MLFDYLKFGQILNDGKFNFTMKEWIMQIKL